MTPLQDQASPTQRVQCPLCLFTNEVPLDAVDPLCLKCQIGIHRLIRTEDDGVDVVPRPEILEEPYVPPTKRARKPTRPKRAKRTVQPYVADPNASVFNIGKSLATPQVPPVTPPYGTPIAPVVALVAPLAVDAVVDERMEATVMHVSSPRAQTVWVLEFESGEVIPLPSDDVVVGRHPEPQDNATPVILPDPTRMLSRTHARLRRDATREVWTITDLGSINGVATVSSDTGAITYATPGVEVDATEYLLIGTLRSRLHRVPQSSHVDATYEVAS